MLLFGSPPPGGRKHNSLYGATLPLPSLVRRLPFQAESLISSKLEIMATQKIQSQQSVISYWCYQHSPPELLTTGLKGELHHSIYKHEFLVSHLNVGVLAIRLQGRPLVSCYFLVHSTTEQVDCESTRNCRVWPAALAGRQAATLPACCTPPTWITLFSTVWAGP